VPCLPFEAGPIGAEDVTCGTSAGGTGKGAASPAGTGTAAGDGSVLTGSGTDEKPFGAV